MFHQTAGIRSIVLRQAHAAHEIGKPGIAEQGREAFMIEQHGQAAIASLECHLQRGKGMILFTESRVNSSNVLPGRAVGLSLLADIPKNFSGVLNSVGLRVYLSDLSSCNDHCQPVSTGL